MRSGCDRILTSSIFTTTSSGGPHCGIVHGGRKYMFASYPCPGTAPAQPRKNRGIGQDCAQLTYVHRPWPFAGLPLIPTDKDRFRDDVLARLSFNVTTRRIGLCGKVLHREGQQPEVIVMRPMAMRWTRAAIAHFAKIVDRLLQSGVLRGVDCKLCYGWRNIVNCPMMPCTGGSIGIVA